MNRFYAALDASQLGPGFVTERADTIVLCDVDGADNQRMAVSLLPQADYQHDVEVLFWSPVEAGGVVGVGNLYVGVSQSGASRSKYVGQQSTSFGLRLDDGKVYSNGVVVASFTPVALGVVIRMRVDVAGGFCTWYAGEALLGTVALPLGLSWLYAVTVSGGAAGSVHCYCNAGPALVSPVRSVTGWWQEAPQLAPLLLSSHDFLTAPTDADPNRRFRRVLSGAAVDNTLAVEFWTDGSDGAASGGAGSIDLVDPARQLIPLLMSHDIRDHAISIELLEEGAPLADAVPIASGVVDGMERTGDSLGQLSVRDPSVELGVPLQPRLVLPNAEPAAVDTAWPVLLGAARSAGMKLIDAPLRRYAVSHQPLAGIATVRCNGKPLDPNATIPDYTLTLDGTCIDLREDLQGRFTLDVTAQGQYVPGSGGVDLLGGFGDFSMLTTTAQLSAHWNRGGALGQGTPSNAAFFPRVRTFGAGTGFVEFIGSATSFNSQSWIVWPTAICQPGRVYKARLYIAYLPGVNSDGRQSYLALAGMPSINGPMYEWHRFVNNAQQMTGEWAAGWYEFVFRNGAPTALPFGVHFFGAVNGEAAVSKVELYELPSATTLPDLDGIPLADYVREVLALAQCRPDLCDIASAEAIDAETGFLYGTQIMETTTAAEAINLALRSCGASIVQRRSGGFAFVRFLDPDDVDDEALGFEITESMLLSEPRQWFDEAPGLTTSVVGGRNIEQYSDADFGDDFDAGTGVPMSIRRLLADPYRWRVSSAIQLAGCYRHALSAAPLVSIFDRREDGRAALDHMLRPYRVPRWFSSIEIARPRGRIVDAGRVHRFTYPGWDFDGRKVHIRAVSDPDSQTATLKIWSR